MNKRQELQDPSRIKDKHEDHEDNEKPGKTDDKPREIGGPKGPEPTRYGDWEKAGRCIDF